MHTDMAGRTAAGFRSEEGNNMVDKIKKMKVEAKLKFCFELVVLIASISGVLGLIFMIRNNISYSNALVTNGFSQGEIGIFSTYLNKEPSIVREMILQQDDAELKAAEAELDELQKQTDAALAEMKLNCTTEEELVYISTIDETLPAYRSIFSEVEKLAVNNHNDEAFEMLMAQGKPTLKKLTTAVEGLIELKVTEGNRVKNSLSIQTYVLAGVMVLVIIAALVLSVKIALFVGKLFAEPIEKVKEASRQLCQGDLNINISPMYPDEIGEMTEHFADAAATLRSYIQELGRVLEEIAAGHFDVVSEVDYRGEFQALDTAIVKITDSLSETMGKINEASEEVALGAGQMAESAQALAEGATDQAGAVQELTATIQNVTEGVVNSADKANQSYKDAEEFEHAAEKSNEDIKDLNQAMERINSTSKEIANIIAEIEDIASQTNLLSLNASIEAARAGEAGRGFAVVADQIGKLASDRANSAVNTKKLIEDSIQEIERGNEITVKATAAMESVINGIKKLAESTREISDLSVDQAEAMKQLEQGVTQISEVIQNNSAAAEETSATSQELSAQSENLETLVRRFVLKG